MWDVYRVDSLTTDISRAVVSSIVRASARDLPLFSIQLVMFPFGAQLDAKESAAFVQKL